VACRRHRRLAWQAKLRLLLSWQADSAPRRFASAADFWNNPEIASQILFGLAMSVFPALVAISFAVAGIPEAAILMGVFAVFVGYFLVADSIRS
jgi:hypothetical protein